MFPVQCQGCRREGFTRAEVGGEGRDANFIDPAFAVAEPIADRPCQRLHRCCLSFQLAKHQDKEVGDCEARAKICPLNCGRTVSTPQLVNRGWSAELCPPERLGF